LIIGASIFRVKNGKISKNSSTIASLFLSNFHVFKPSTPLSLAAYFVKHEETRLDGLLSASLQGVSFQAYVLMGTLM